MVRWTRSLGREAHDSSSGGLPRGEESVVNNGQGSATTSLANTRWTASEGADTTGAGAASSSMFFLRRNRPRRRSRGPSPRSTLAVVTAPPRLPPRYLWCRSSPRGDAPRRTRSGTPARRSPPATVSPSREGRHPLLPLSLSSTWWPRQRWCKGGSPPRGFRNGRRSCP